MSEAVHPHARGEHRRWRRMALRTSGSSPRPWGTLLDALHDDGSNRFIPTPVGNTSTGRKVRPPRTVHPHARGEHFNYAAPASQKFGSSPRPWGTLGRAARIHVERRFIPTPVGNTLGVATVIHSTTVHPHARGEHVKVKGGFREGSGSSPRPWGTPWRVGNRS